MEGLLPRTGTAIESSIVSDPPRTRKRTRPGPTASAVVKMKLTVWSPGPAKATVFVRSPSMRNMASVSRATVTSLMAGLVTKTETGISTRSPGRTTRGKVGRAMRSRRTGTDLPADPNAPSRPPTTMTLTAPKYCGISNS